MGHQSRKLSRHEINRLKQARRMIKAGLTIIEEDVPYSVLIEMTGLVIKNIDEHLEDPEIFEWVEDED